MQTSNYLKQALFYKSSHEKDQCFEMKSEALFQRPGKNSFIEVHYQQPGQQKLPSPTPFLESVEESDCSSVRSFLLDQSCCSSLDEDPPPTYDNSPGLLRQDILDLKDVQQIETVSVRVAALSTYANTHGDEGNKALFPPMVSEPFKPSDSVYFDRPMVVSYAKSIQ